MKIYALNRGRGKTTRLLYLSEFHKTPILCVFEQSKKHLLSKAQELGICIPTPLTITDITARGKRYENPHVLIDEAQDFLQRLLSHVTGGEINEVLAMTIDKEQVIETIK